MPILGNVRLLIRVSDGGQAQESVFKQILQLILKLSNIGEDDLPSRGEETVLVVSREALREQGERLSELRILRVLTHTPAIDIPPHLLILTPNDTVAKIQEALSSSVGTKL